MKSPGIQDAIASMPDGKFGTIVIDPPWPMQKIEREVGFDYPTMSEDELRAFGESVAGTLAVPFDIGRDAMPLSTQLRAVDFFLRCKYCGHPTTKKGSWFMTIHRFECEGCKRDVSVTYSDKLALFAEHAHLANTKAIDAAAQQPDQIAALPPQGAARPAREPKAR
jgi:hypothetical protein